MGEFLKCECSHCGQPIEFPSEGIGQIVPCPTCKKTFTLASESIRMLKSNCSHCFGGIEFSENGYGYKVSCPHCGQKTELGLNLFLDLKPFGMSSATKNKMQFSKCEPAPSVIPPPSPRRKRTPGVPLRKLTEETIKVRTNTGDTPLHRAAKTGRISEIPRHLLTAELFKIGNYRHETPIEVAARYGQLDKVPKEFLTPELLSVAVSFYGTVLHHLAYMKMLGFIPDVYANSPMWNLRNTRGQTPRDVLEEVIEQERRQRERKSWVPPRLTLPIQTEPSKLLPAFSDESLRTIQIRATTSADIYSVNLLDYTCSNPLCKEIHSEVPLRDFGRLCKHIILALRQKNLVKQLPPIARGIAENGLPYDAYGIYPGRFAGDLYGRPIYITGPNYDGWVSIFALKRRNGVNYYRFGYNIKSKDSLQTMTSTGAAFYRVCPAIDASVLH